MNRRSPAIFRRRGGGPHVATDGNVFVPATAAQWQMRGIAVPDSWWGFQEAASPIADLQTTGADIDLVVGGSTFQQAVTGWSGYFLQFAEAVGEQALLNSASYNPATASVAALCYANIINAGALRAFTRLGVQAATVGGGGVLLRFNAAGTASVHCDGVNTAGVTNYEGDGLVHPFLLVYNRTAGSIALFTNTEQIIGTYSANAINGTAKGFGGGGGTTPVACKIRFGAWWYGANAETVGKVTLQRLNWPLAY